MKISILTPAYNAGAYIERAIQSVLAQSDPDFEHIIVDGGSGDNTLDILKKYPHLKWISEPDRGQCDAMNKAFAMSRGDVIAYLNADDWFEAEVFAHVRNLFDRDKKTDILVGNLYVRYLDSHDIRLVVPSKTYRGILQNFRNDFPLNPVSYFYRRKVQERIGQFPTDLHFTMDYWFLLRAFMSFKIGTSDMVMGTFFLSGINKTLQSAPSERPFEIAVQHLIEHNRLLVPWYYAKWLLHYWVVQFPERCKRPIRVIVFTLLFSRRMSFEEYTRMGLRKAYSTFTCRE